jgi:hypothetical protein
MLETLRRRMPTNILLVGLVLAGSIISAAPSFAASTKHSTTETAPYYAGDALTRALEVDFADSHWNWTAWNDPTPVASGSGQSSYQCAEFVARSLAAAGLVPGLDADSPQDDYFHYHAPNGVVYDLLLITPLPKHKTIYDFLMDSGLATDVGDYEGAAQPGDMVVTYRAHNGEASHMGLIATAEATVDAHNNARYRYGYHYYAPSHLVKLVPNAFSTVWTWAAQQWLSHDTSETVNQNATANDTSLSVTVSFDPRV